MSDQFKHLLISTLLSSSLLLGCGGSSSTNSVNSTPISDVSGTDNPQVDAPELLTKQFIAGLRYTTESQSGTTTDDREFSFLAGETVTFYIGPYKLPAVLAQRRFTPLGYVPNSFSDDEPGVINLTRLLQSLDVDLSPSNGIQLPESLSQVVINETAKTLDITYPSQLFERMDLVLELLIANNVTELIDADIASAAFQNELDNIEDAFIVAAIGDIIPKEGGCTDVRNGFVSPFPCIPGTGGFALGNLKVESIVSPEHLVSASGGRRRDTITGDNRYINDMHRLAGAPGFGDPFEITEFADSLDVGIVLFTTTDRNPFRDDVIIGGGWGHTELFLNSSYIGNLPFSSDSNLQHVIDRCGLSPKGTRRVILPPGTYSWNAHAYESYGCRTGFYCPSVEQASQQTVGGVIVTSGNGFSMIDEGLVEQGQNPVWDWGGSFEVQKGECTVINALGDKSPTSEVPPFQGDFTELYGRYYGSDWEDYTVYDFDGNANYKQCTEHIIDEDYTDIQELHLEIESGYLIAERCPIIDIATFACHTETEFDGSKSKYTQYTWNPSISAESLEIFRSSCEDSGIFEFF